MRNEENNQNGEITDSTRFLSDILDELGFQPEIAQDGMICLMFNNNKFRINYEQNRLIIWNIGWQQAVLDGVDDPEIYDVYNAVNATNYNCGPTVIVYRSNETLEVWFHSHWEVFYDIGNPEISGYIPAILNAFLEAQNMFRFYYMQISGRNAQ